MAAASAADESEARPPPAPRQGNPLPVLLLSTLVPIGLVLIAHPLLPLVVSESLAARVGIPPHPTFPALQASVGLALFAFVGAVLSVPIVGDAFISKGLKGRDLLKPGGRTSGPWM
jgi:UDP-N-acetylglucosamine--dolichyl-phosphate N-acetylglucosaminephosphotransferase